MPVTTAPLDPARDILASVGLTEDLGFIGPYTGEDDRAVLTVPQMIMAAWAANDADLFAGVFTDNGSLLMRNDQLTSREQIHAYMADGFRGVYRGARVIGWPLDVKYLAPDVAMIVTQGGILLDGDTELHPDREIRAIWIVVARDRRWRLMSHQSSPIRG